ncbi:MAG: iron-containing alcohol dehydrogenase [Aristaeellaceae bacterium]
MQLFECPPVISRYASLEEFLRAECVRPGDLVLTSRHLGLSEAALHGARVLYQEDYGAGEPTDAMLLELLQASGGAYGRVIGIGGGTVLDLAKLLSLQLEKQESPDSLHALFTGGRPVRARCPTVLAPTTCGTGSEVTRVAVLLFRDRNMKLGLSHPALYARHAALIPSLLETLPRRPFVFSAVDALIHACESALSPKASAFTRPLSEDAIRMILGAFRTLADGGRPDTAMYGALLEAAAMAGIAFGNAGCGAVHAMSYPIGGQYHLPHGEANAVVFLPVLRFYARQESRRPLERLTELLAECLACAPGETLDALDRLLDRIVPRPGLHALGADGTDLQRFAAQVYQQQQRLLSCAMTPMTQADVLAVYHTA